MASIVLSQVGSWLGGELLPGLGSRVLGMLGSSYGKAIDKELFGSSSGGSKLENLRVSDSRYGLALTVPYGQTRVAGNVIWCSDLIETTHESSTSIGKGGGSVSASTTTYTYSVHCAIAICEGEISDIGTIWADTTVIYQNGVWNSGLVESATFYKGSLTQEADPLMESYIGAGEVPAYRGVAYVVIESLQLKSFGNRLPSLGFEIAPSVDVGVPSYGASVDTGFCQNGNATMSKSMEPITLSGTGTCVTKMLVGGYELNGTSARACVAEVDTSGMEPSIESHAESSYFSCSDAPHHAWALAPDGRYVALCYNVTEADTLHRFLIYDTETKRFGTPLSVTMTYVTDDKQIVWVDAQRFAVVDQTSGKLGLHIFLRAGLSVIDLGFFDVWGANAGKVPLSYAQFMRFSGGVYFYVGDKWPGFTAIYARAVSWNGNGLTVQEPWTLTSGYSSGTASQPQICFLKNASDEWTLYYATTLAIKMISFKPGLESVQITRPWQSFSNSYFTLSVVSHPICYGSRLLVVQRNASDSCYWLSVFELGDGAFSRLTGGVKIQDPAFVDDLISAASIDRSRFLLLPVDTGDSCVSMATIVKFQDKSDALSSIVGDVLERAGYEDADRDLTALEDVSVTGYLLDDVMTAAEALKPLQIFKPFDLIESEGVLKAVLHGGDAVASLALGEGGGISEGEASETPEAEIARVQELDLPLEVAVDYTDASRDYEVGSQRARRIATKGATSCVKVTLPVVCTASEAKQIAEGRLREAWGERDSLLLRLSKKWLALEPGDVVSYDGRDFRLEQVRLERGVWEARGVFVPPVLESEASADTGSYESASTSSAFASVPFLLDIPLLRSEDDQPGFYVGVAGSEGWKGASLWRAWDGSDYVRLASFSNVLVAGAATTVLADGVPYYADEVNSVDVQLIQGELSSCSESAWLAGSNAALIGDEIVQFRTATLLEEGYYRLSGLLRGRRATESGTGTHALGERFVLLNENALQFLPVLLSDRGREGDFRALSNGQSLGDAADTAFSCSLGAIKPFSPVHLGGVRANGAGGDLVISWVRRARVQAEWADYIDVPLDEDSESYEVDILKDGVVLRTFEVQGTTSLSYSAALQTADWSGSIPSKISIAVYQMSARYGRGEAAYAEV